MEGKKDYFTATELRERSWTERIIKKLNLTPCGTTPNPEYSALSIKIYDRNLVENCEATDEFKALVKADKSKKKGALKEDKKRKEKLLEEVGNVEIKVEYVLEPFLTTMALADYNTWRIEKRKTFDWASGKSDKRFQRKIRRNYTRHNLTNYDQIMHEIAKKLRSEDEYAEIRSILIKRIKETWKVAENETKKDNLSTDEPAKSEDLLNRTQDPADDDVHDC
ncbi:MAG: hypothetical protein AB7D09_08875 [Methanosarcina sp.]